MSAPENVAGVGAEGPASPPAGSDPAPTAGGAPATFDLGNGLIATTSFALLSAALARAQGAFGQLVASHVAEVVGSKNGKQYRYQYRYADLADALAAAMPALSAEGLAIVQSPAIRRGDDGGPPVVTVTTILSHESGEWMRSTLPMLAADSSPQKLGAAMTYARRYALLAMIGLAPEDDDGGAPRPRERQSNGRRRDDSPPPDDEPVDELEAEIRSIRAGVPRCRSVNDVLRLVDRVNALPDGTPEADALFVALKTRQHEIDPSSGGSVAALRDMARARKGKTS